jgi:hypothetical protein
MRMEKNMTKRKKGQRRGSKLGGTYVGLLNGVKLADKAKARDLQKKKGFAAAIAFLKKARKKA